MRKHRNSSCYHFRVRIPLDLQKHFKDKKDFTISLRTGVYRDASRTATRLYTLSQIIFDKIRMQEIDLDHEGVKKVLLVEITRNIKNAQLTKWESKTDVKRMKVDISLESSQDEIQELSVKQESTGTYSLEYLNPIKLINEH